HDQRAGRIEQSQGGVGTGQGGARVIDVENRGKRVRGVVDAGETLHQVVIEVETVPVDLRRRREVSADRDRALVAGQHVAQVLRNGGQVDVPAGDRVVVRAVGGRVARQRRI